MLKKIIKNLVNYSFFSLCFCLSFPVAAGWQLEWIDNFDGNLVDRGNWTSQVETNYNNEVQCYTDDDTSANKNYDVSNGTLKIIARKQDVDCVGLGGTPMSWTSGRINSKDKREFLYGRIEARIRFNDLRGGTWPAFWMLENRINESPVRGDNDFVAWPNPGAGEIDVWEWFSNNPSTYLTNFYNTNSCGSEVRYPYPGGSPDVLQWHDYAIEWDKNSIKFFADDIMVTSHDITNCPQYKEPMFVLLNLAMGGDLGGNIDNSLNTATMEVDYVAHCSTSASNNLSRCNQSTPAANKPVVTSSPITSVFSNNLYTYTLIATDADGDNLTLSAPVLPSWLTFNTTTGLLSGTPSTANVGSYIITLKVNDGTTEISQVFTLLVSTPPVLGNTAPTINSTANLQSQVGVDYSYTLLASDTDGNVLFLSASVLPSWLTFNTTTGLLSGTPSTVDIGISNVTLSVNDGVDSITQDFNVTVVAEQEVTTSGSGGGSVDILLLFLISCLLKFRMYCISIVKSNKSVMVYLGN